MIDVVADYERTAAREAAVAKGTGQVFALSNTLLLLLLSGRHHTLQSSLRSPDSRSPRGCAGGSSTNSWRRKQGLTPVLICWPMWSLFDCDCILIASLWSQPKRKLVLVDDVDVSACGYAARWGALSNSSSGNVQAKLRSKSYEISWRQ